MPQDLNISVRVLPSLLRNCYLLTAISTTFFMFNFLNPKNEKIGAEMVYLNILSIFLLFYALYNNYTAGLWMTSEIEYAENNYRDDLQNSLDLFKQRMFQNNIFNFFLISLIGFAILNVRYSDIYIENNNSDNNKLNISPNNNINNQIPIEYPFQNVQIPLQTPVQNNKIQYSQIPNYNYYPNVSSPIKLGD